MDLHFRALVVDDDAYSRAICTTLLRQIGAVDVVQAAGGAEAILSLLEAPFGLVLMDWYMPDINARVSCRCCGTPGWGSAR